MEIMVDLETMGLGPDAAIVAIGATKFALGEELISTFYVNVDLADCLNLGLTVSASTIMWWLQQDHAAREALQVDRLPLVTALDQFSSWLGTDVDGVWGNGASFDNVILANAYQAISKDCPWPFYSNRCYRTVKAMIGGLVLPPDPVGVAHNALDDAIYQTRYLNLMVPLMGGAVG